MTTTDTGPPHEPAQAMTLTEEEAACLAQRIVAHHLADDDADWAHWELFPELSEASYELLLNHLAVIAVGARVKADRLDERYGIDSKHLRERAS